MNTVVSNNARKIRASRPDGISMPTKGNRYSSSLARTAQRDTKPAFPQIVFGNLQPYRVDPFEDVDGVWFDVPKTRQMGIIPGAAPEPKPARKPAAKKRTRRQDPGPGTRPSLSKIRSKG